MSLTCISKFFDELVERCKEAFVRPGGCLVCVEGKFGEEGADMFFC